MTDSLENHVTQMFKEYSPFLPEKWQELIVNIEVCDEDLDIVACIQTEDIHSQQMLPEIKDIEILLRPLVDNLAEKQEEKGELTEAKITVSNDMVVGIELQFQNDST